MITKQEKAQIRSILQSPQWGSVEHLANELCSKITGDSPLRETEWETLRSVILQAGQVEGIKRLLQELYLCTQNDIT